MNIKARTSFGAVLTVLVVFGFWLGGFTFVRGESMALMYFVCLGAAILGFTCPYFDKETP